MSSIDNIDPLCLYFDDEKLKAKIYNFFIKKNFRIINSKEYLDKDFDFSITKGKPLPQIKNVGMFGTILLKDIKSIQENRTFKKLRKQINRIQEGKYAPITIDRVGYIINGHHRYDAVRIFKFKKIAVRVLNINAKDLINLELSSKELSKLFQYNDFNSLRISSFKPSYENFNKKQKVS